MFLSLLILLTSPAQADAQAANFTILSEGQCAPFEGVLFDKYATAEILSSYDRFVQACDNRVKYELKKQEEVYEYEAESLRIEHRALTKEYDLFIEQKDKEIQSLVKSLKKTSPRNKWLWFAGGIVVGTAASYGAYKIYDER
tara:strand:- start:199 stop:624 length:426 start_codon:yes stop_codon:yes gene_type:complete